MSGASQRSWAVSPAALLIFFLGGAAALIYELVWFYLVQLVVGASALSVAVILASFMGGMALGSALLPRLIPHTRHPWRVVAVLETLIACLGAAMPITLPLIQEGYQTLVGHGYTGVLARAAVSIVALMPPTLLMGATLPAIARSTAATRTGASEIGLLYMANIGGGAVGTVVAGFYLLRVFDTRVATGVAVALNLAAAAAAWSVAKRRRHAREADAAPGAEASTALPSPAPALVYVVAGLSGLTALGAEVVWTRQLSLLFGASVYTFSLILTVFLGGLGMGSFLGAGLARRRPSPATTLAWCQVVLVLAIAYGSRAIVELLPHWQPTTTFLPAVRRAPALTFAFDAVRAAVALLPATLLWGASFPLAVAAATGGRDAGRAVAGVNATNTIGALAGAVGFTLVGIPVFGSQRAQQALAVLAALGALTMFWSVRRDTRRGIAAAALIVSLALGLWIIPPVPGRLIAFGRSVDSWDSIKRFLYLEEGATASVAVTEGAAGAKQFHIAGKVEASDMDVDMRLERMLGHVPALLHPNPRTILVVGVGAGVTAGAFTVHPEVERIVICEIEPVVPASARAYFADENHRVFDDPRTTLVFDDARHFLQTTTETFDIITSDPIHPWVRGAATLYSLEYLELVRRHLNPGGIVTQWVPLYETDERSVKSQIGTFARVFSDTTLWNPDLLEEGYDLVVLGRESHTPIDERMLGERLEKSPRLSASLGEVSLGSAAAVLSTYAGRGRDLAPWLEDAEINRERQLRLQYLAGLAANLDQRFAIFQTLVRYRKYPTDLFAASPETEAQLRRWYLR